MSGGGSNTLLKHLSTFFFGCNYAGIIYGALTLTGSGSSSPAEDEKKKVNKDSNYSIIIALSDNCRQACYFHGE